MKLGMIVFLLPLQVFATAPRHAPSSEEAMAIKTYHQKLNQQEPKAFGKDAALLRPYSEVEAAGYFLMSADAAFDSSEAKHTMVRNLPDGVTAIIFTEPGSDKSALLKDYRDAISADRLKIVEIEDAELGFWARDGLPLAIWRKASDDKGEIAMVDAKYYHRFEPDQLIAQWFSAPLLKNGYYYEGGNFMANDQGDCLMVDNDQASEMPTRILTDLYACQNVVRLPFEKGIGHVDESARFLRSRSIVTDSESYAKILRAKGFEVQILPRPHREYETYVNALLVNDVVYVPVFGEEGDEKALSVYRSFGLKVIPIQTRSLSNDGLGSLHCITMTYPKVPFQSLLKALGAKEI